MPNGTRPLYRLDRFERAAEAARFVGQYVTITVSPLRNTDSATRRTYTGRLIAVAGSLTSGTTAEIAVLNITDGGVKWAPLATVESIEPRPAPRQVVITGGAQ